MAQDDLVIDASQPGEAFTEQLNAALKSLFTLYYGGTNPLFIGGALEWAPVAEGAMWWDSSSSPVVLKTYTGSDWVVIAQLDGLPHAALQALLDEKMTLAGGSIEDGGLRNLLGSGGVIRMDSGYTPSDDFDLVHKAYVDAKAYADSVSYLFQGTLTVTDNLMGKVLDKGGTFSNIRVRVGTAPVGSNLTIRIAILPGEDPDGPGFSDAAVTSRTATVVAGDQYINQVITPYTVYPGDLLRLDVTEIGATTPGGNDLYVTCTIDP